MWNLKYHISEPIHETDTDSQTLRTYLWLPGRGEWGRGGLEVWDEKMQTIMYRMDKQGPNVEHGELYSISYAKA